MPSESGSASSLGGRLGALRLFTLQKNNPGKRVLVIDRYGAPGQGNTGRSNAMFRNTFSSSDNQTLANSSIDFYTNVQEELGVGIGLQKIGYLWLMGDTQLSRSEPFLQRMGNNGIEIVRRGRDELGRLLPSMVTEFRSNDEAQMMELPSVEGGVFGPKCGRLDPDKLTRFYASEIVRSGGKFAFNTEVDALVVGPSKRVGIEGEPLVWQESEIEGVSVHGPVNGTLQADTVVVAGGAWLNELLEPIGIDGHVKAKKRQLFSVHADGAELAKLLHPDGFNSLGQLPLVILPKAGVHFKPVAEEGCFWVACEDEVNRPFIDLPEHDLDRYEAESNYYERSVYPVLASYFPDFRGSRMKAMWAGLYAYNTIDNLPFVFRENNLIVAGGDSGSGIMKGDSLGRMVDSLYREEDETALYGGIPCHTSKLGFEKRDVEREEWVL